MNPKEILVWDLVHTIIIILFYYLFTKRFCNLLSDSHGKKRRNGIANLLVLACTAINKYIVIRK